LTVAAGASGAAGALAAAAYRAYEKLQDPRSGFFGPTFTGIGPGHGVVALTFDDGPNAGATVAVLDALRDAGVRATFFVVGRAAAAQPELLRRMMREGHAVGNHGWRHRRLNFASRRGIEEELGRTDDAIFAATGARSRLVRPPFGARSFRVLNEIRRLGYTCVLWSAPLARDWAARDAGEIAEAILEGASDGSVIVLHDGDKGRPAERREIAGAVRLLVRGLRERGIGFATIPEMIELGRAR
jgi:peptidoglycan/xylan/chitin deacetylase (PgdA/CDA1 family)